MATVDVTQLPAEELYQDYWDSLADVQLCKTALAQGTTHYGEGQDSVAQRLADNQAIMAIILAELKRRNLPLDR
jgi:hypothetical protein